MNKFAQTITYLISLNTGIVIHSVIPKHLYTSLTISVSIFTLPYLFIKSKKEFKIILTSIIFLIIGLTISDSKEYKGTAISIENYNDTKKSIIEGVIIKEPDHRTDKSKYTIQVQKINNNPSQGRILINTLRYPEYEIGNQLTIKATPKTPPEDEDFSYKNYLSMYQIHSFSSNAEIIKSNKKYRFPSKITQAKVHILRKIYKTKLSFEKNLSTLFNEPTNSLAAGLLIGSRKGIPEEINEDFRVTGLSHIVAISGSNITLIAAIILSILKPIGRRPALFITIIAIIIFTIITGASSAVVRASIMGSIGIFALLNYRESNTTMLLLLTLTIMLINNPLIFWYDVGFSLSFMATLGVIYLNKYTEIISSKIPLPKIFQEAISLTLAAQITTTPIIIYLFKNISIVSPLANTLVSPLLSPAMFLPFLSFAVQKIPIIAEVTQAITYFTIELLTAIINLCAKIPYANIETKQVNILCIISYYIILLIIILKLKSRENIST